MINMSNLSPCSNNNVSLFTEEDKATYIKELNEAKDKVVYPNNPCLYTPSIKIHDTNKQIELMKNKYK